MKRVLLHLAFWVLYTVQDALLVYTWVGPLLGPMSESRLARVSLEAALLMDLPKFLLVYFVLYVTIPRIRSGAQQFYRIVIELLLVLVVTIVIYRVIGKYIINVYTYGNVLRPSALFDVRSLLMTIMDLGAVTGFAAFIKFVRMQLASKEREKNMIKEKLETELKFLRNQTNPHFLMNTLNNIYALARKKSDDTAEVVMKLSELLRFILYESGEKRIRLADEVKVLEDYLELEKMRYNQRLTVRFEKNIDNGSYQITPLLLLPFVENAFKHGVSETRFESFIDINLAAQDGRLHFVIENSKDQKEINKKPNSIGLNNVRRQLELMYSDYGLDVQDEQNSFKANLTIKLDSYAEI
jgi:two-component system, LytTR family, sensor kinase